MDPSSPLKKGISYTQHAVDPVSGNYMQSLSLLIMVVGRQAGWLNDHFLQVRLFNNCVRCHAALGIVYTYG